MPCVPDDDAVGFTPTDDYRWQNFVRTIDYRVPRHFEASNLADLVWIAAAAEREGRRLKATGNRWSIEPAAVSEDWVVDIARLNRRLDYLVEAGVGSRALTDEWRRAQFGDSDVERLVHVEAGIKMIDLNRRLWPEYSMLTLGGAQGQTLAGATSTGTHGSDYQFPPLCDAIEAVHLVTTGGQEVWIESSRRPLTRDDASLLAALPCPDTRIIRDDAALNAVVCGVGRFGIIYSVVLRVTRAFRLSEWTQHLDWSRVSPALARGIGAGTGSPFGSINAELDDPPWDLRISVSPTEYRYFDLAFNTRKMDQCWVRRRWPTREDGDIGLSTSNNVLCHPTVGNAVLAAAAVLLDTVAVGFAASLFLAWKAPVVTALAADLKNLATHHDMTGGRALAAVVNAVHHSEIFGGELRWIIDEVSQMALSGEFGTSMATGKRGPSWQVSSGLDETSFRPDCYNGSSIELTFGLQTTAYLDFIEVIRQNAGRYVQVGYVSVRFSRGSNALLSMHHVEYPVACAIEVVCLRGLSDTQRWLRFLLQEGQALGGRPHWGQQHDLRSYEVEQLYGEESLNLWREQLMRIAGPSQTFSNDFTSRRGLEPVGMRRRVTGARQSGGAITHLCHEGEYWSPVTVDEVIRDITLDRFSYFVAAPDGSAETPIIVRRVLTTEPDDTRANNLDELPEGSTAWPLPDASRRELRVTSVVRSTGRWPSVRFLCNDAERWCVSFHQVFSQLSLGTHEYWVEVDGSRVAVLARQYLTTAADATERNNLDELPPC
jgi:hypothetical protein